MSSSFSFTCELSGEPLASAKDEVVVTPSGHVCLKLLLLEKLSENGGTDPFETGVPLNEDNLITLSSHQKLIPPRPHVTSMPSLLNLLQGEYNALTLELFDTRKALEETRKELSHALYQQDAAVRVVARLSMERDAARQELAQWKASGSVSSGGATTSVAPVEQQDEQEPPTKRAKVDITSSSGKIPAQDLEVMTETWQTLSQQRKQRKKEVAARMISAETLETFTEVDKKAWHKSRSKAGIVDMAYSSPPNLIATAGRDKQIVVYSTAEKTLVHTINLKSIATSVDLSETYICAGLPKNKVVLYSATDASMIGEALELESPIVNVALHPTGKHAVVTCQEGKVAVCRLVDNGIELVTQFESPEREEYTCATLHPDGLIHAVGTSSGKIHLWDFKSQQLASTIESDELKDSPIVAMAFSNNGYHLAVATEGMAQVRDIRKNKTVSTLEKKGIAAVQFDDSGKYLAVGGEEGTTVMSVKEGSTIATIGNDDHAVSGLIWTTDQQIVTCGNADRQVRFYGVESDGDDEEMKD